MRHLGRSDRNRAIPARARALVSLGSRPWCAAFTALLDSSHALGDTAGMSSDRRVAVYTGPGTAAYGLTRGSPPDGTHHFEPARHTASARFLVDRELLP